MFDFPGGAEVVAHRGYSAAAPENTLVALDRGIDAGADAVEFDLHVTSDGVPVLMHDTTLDRTTNATGSVEAVPLSALRGLDAGSWFDPSFAGEPVPTLAQAVERCAGRAGRIYAEVKRSPRPSDLDEVARVVRDGGVWEETVFISMDWPALLRIRAFDTSARIGYIVEHPGRTENAIARSAHDPLAMIDFDARILLAQPDVARRCTELGIPLACWTVNETADAQRLVDMGVPRITTNEVSAMVAWKETLRS
ncbi:MAG: glycerophosphodiester phosphodiesterase family protein [Gemmatimonadota bacterium]